MKRNNSLIIFCSLLFIFISCKNNNDNKELSGKIKPADSPSQENSAAFSGSESEGFSCNGKMIIVQNIRSKSPQGEAETKKEFTYVTKRTITKIEPNGDLIIKRTPLLFAFKADGGINYASDRSPERDIPQDLWVHAKEIGESLTLKLTKNGEVSLLSNQAEILKNMKKKGEALYGENYKKSPILDYLLNDYYSTTKISERIRSEFELFISADRKPGESWQKEPIIMFNVIKSQSKINFVAKTEGLYEVEYNQELSLLDGKTELDTNFDKDAKKSIQSFHYLKASGGSSGRLFVSPKTGLVHHGSVTQKYTYIMENKNQESGKMEQYETDYSGTTNYSSQ